MAPSPADGRARPNCEGRSRPRPWNGSFPELVDATGAFREYSEDVYVDVCHFGKRGNEILADAIAEALLRTLSR